MSPAFGEIDKTDSYTLYAGTLDDPSDPVSTHYRHSSLASSSAGTLIFRHPSTNGRYLRIPAGRSR
jgi:hypothetical protein